jgi:hypothetical protein
MMYIQDVYYMDEGSLATTWDLGAIESKQAEQARRKSRWS